MKSWWIELPDPITHPSDTTLWCRVAPLIRLAGKFRNPNSTLPPPLPGSLFDVLVAYGRDTTGTFRFVSHGWFP